MRQHGRTARHRHRRWLDCAAIAHDLALRGPRVTVVERGGVASGTTGHNQAQLHSGARYAVNDPESARECIEENEENTTLRKIMPEGLELNDGLFVALTEEHLAYRPAFLEACARCGIPAREIPAARALELEPRLNPRLLAAVSRARRDLARRRADPRPQRVAADPVRLRARPAVAEAVVLGQSHSLGRVDGLGAVAMFRR